MSVARRSLLLVLGLAVVVPAPADPAPSSTGLEYRIEVRVDPADRRFEGRQTLRWRNPSATAVETAPLHLYLNAFANRSSTWLQESAYSGFRRFDFKDFYRRFPDPWGWIEVERVLQKTPGEPALEVPWKAVQPDDGNPLDRTLIELQLARPVAAGRWMELEITFSGRLPNPFARTGCAGEYCLVGQWFPKLAAFETRGVRGAREDHWAARQFHATAEFYANFADYDVTIEAPAGWTVGATGRRVSGSERAAEAGTRSHRFVQQAVHDFAFVLGRDFIDAVQTLDAPGRAGTVEIHLVAPREETRRVERWMRVCRATLATLARAVGPYPYPTLTIVVPTALGDRTEGMEYPTLVVSSVAGDALESWPRSASAMADNTLIHELVHQYFYGLLASNEQENAFLDEGLTSYWQIRVAEDLFGPGHSGGTLFGREAPIAEFFRLGLGALGEKIDEPLRHQPTFLFKPTTHAMQFYARGALTIMTAERLFGRERIDAGFATYYRQWRMRHPAPEDFLAAMAEGAGREPAAFLREAFDRPRLPDYRVETLRCERLGVPPGSYPSPDGRIEVPLEGAGEDAQWRLMDLPHTRDAEGRVWVEISDPGRHRPGAAVEGTVSWQGFVPEQADAAAAEAASGPEEEDDRPTLQACRAQVAGPAWDHLPVDVQLVFDDGLVITDHWDGRAPWRAYRTQRRGRLVEVRIDPTHRILLDGSPADNGRRLEADPRFTAEWSGWMTALAQLLAAGLSLWL
ncbi:MAG: M1 family metallopeptidase [Acidobacteriota bacterium]|nr:M1 family metallopeptidase [Acidobacteriota bacterium]